MKIRAQAVKMVLAVFLILSTSSSKGETPLKAPPFDWFFISNYLGLDQHGLSVLFKNSRGGRAWNISPVPMKGKSPSQLVSWNLPNNATVKFLLVGGKTELVILVIGEFAFDDIEEQSNRKMTALSDHTWVDRARNEWGLERIAGTKMCALRVNLPTH